MLSFRRHSRSGEDHISFDIDHLVIAGWTGRDEAAVQHHIEELAAIGVPPPSTVPVYYRVSAATLTQTATLSVLGPDTSGEAEPVVVAMADGLWFGLGSDHTDRKAETIGIALSKQLCCKVIAKDLWRFDEVEAHWDHIEMRSRFTIEVKRALHQEGTPSPMRQPADLLSRDTGGGPL